MKTLPLMLALCFLSACGESRRQAQSCPNWSDSPTANYSNKDLSNFGCAWHNNVNAQVADKRDLTQGEGRKILEADRESIAMQKYLTSTQQALPSLSTSAGR